MFNTSGSSSLFSPISVGINTSIKQEIKSDHPVLDELRKNAPYSFLKFLDYVKIDGEARFGNTSGLQSFKLYPEQLWLWNEIIAQYDEEYVWKEEQADGTFKDILSKRRFVRMAISKARQVGTSTFLILFYLYLTLVMQKNVGVVNHTNEKNKNLHKKLVLAFENLPPEVKGKFVWQGSGEKEIKFNIYKKGDNQGTGKSIVFSSSESPGGSRGNTLKGMLFTECGFYAKGKNIDLQSVALEPDTFVFYESTPWGGSGNLLADVYNSWKKDTTGFNSMHMVFQKWWTIPKYRESPPATYKVSPKVLDYFKKHRFVLIDKADLTEREQKDYLQKEGTNAITLSQAYWMERKMASDPDLSSLEEFSKAYPPSLEACFSTNVSSAFCNIALLSAALELGKDRRNVVRTTVEYGVYIGVDVAFKKDKTVIAVRQGPNVLDLITVEFMEESENYTEIKQDTIAKKILETANRLLDEGKMIIRINIDTTNGGGTAVVSSLQSMIRAAPEQIGRAKLLASHVWGLHMQHSVDLREVGDPHIAGMSCRDYIHFKFADWLSFYHEQNILTYVKYNENILPEAMATLTYMGVHGQLKIIEKPKIQRAIRRSPDTLDAIVMSMHGDTNTGIKPKAAFDQKYQTTKREFIDGRTVNGVYR